MLLFYMLLTNVLFRRQADIALIGLAVMGQNLILNMDSHGFVVCAYNRTVDKVIFNFFILFLLLSGCLWFAMTCGSVVAAGNVLVRSLLLTNLIGRIIAIFGPRELYSRRRMDIFE